MSRVVNALISLGVSGFPWCGARRDIWAAAGRRAVMRRWPAPLRPFAWLGMAVLWPVTSLALSMTVARAARTAPPGFWLRAWTAALTRNIPPREFADYQLHRQDKASQNWAFTQETALALAQMADRQASALIADKSQFADWMADQDIPHVPVLREAPPGVSIVIKPRRGAQGRGVRAWTWKDDTWHNQNGFQSGQTGQTSDDLSTSFSADTEIMQPLIPPALGHPAVARIITAKGALQPLEALLQSPAEGDFCSHRGPFRRIDVTTGTVLPPGPGQRTSLYGAGPDMFTLEGAVLPDWPTLCSELTHAHGLLPGPVMIIGWDVLWSPDGPLVLEANTGIAFHLFQADTLRPFELARFLQPNR